MNNTALAFCLLATALGTAPALAQNAPSATPPAASPSASMPGGSGQFLTHLGREQIRGSRLIGVNIYGPNDERVGDVNDVILDRNGNASAVVIGVGGFLGIGEKDVAIPYRMVEWRFGEPAGTATGTGTGSGMTSGNGTGAGSGVAATVAGTANTGVASGAGMEGPRGGAASGSAGGTAASGTPSAAASDQGYPTRGVIRLSRADLQNAPSFSFSMNAGASDRPMGDRPAGAAQPSAPAMAPGNVPPTQRP